MNDSFDLDAALGDIGQLDGEAAAPAAPERPRRDLSQFLRKIPVTVTLEVGATQVSLLDLAGLEQGSVLELDKLAGEPLDIKVNNTRIGRAEVVVMGENYGLRVVELDNLDFDSLSA